MNQNIGATDKVIRYVIGITALVLGIFYENWWGAIGLVPILTASIGWCPLYAPFGIRTKKAEQS